MLWVFISWDYHQLHQFNYLASIFTIYDMIYLCAITVYHRIFHIFWLLWSYCSLLSYAIIISSRFRSYFFKSFTAHFVLENLPPLSKGKMSTGSEGIYYSWSNSIDIRLIWIYHNFDWFLWKKWWYSWRIKYIWQTKFKQERRHCFNWSNNECM